MICLDVKPVAGRLMSVQAALSILLKSTGIALPSAPQAQISGCGRVRDGSFQGDTLERFSNERLAPTDRLNACSHPAFFCDGKATPSEYRPV